MSEYMCEHGHLYASCPICSEIMKAMSDYLMEDSWDTDDYLYDHYLDLDERLLREQEEN